MALADTAYLAAQLDLKGNFASQMTGARKVLGQFDSKLTDTQGRAYKAGQQIGTGIKSGLKIAAVGVGLLFTQVVAGLGQLMKLESAMAQTNAVIKSTKGVAGVSAVQVRKLAESYEALNATVDDKVIQSTENLLLTFTKVDKNAFQPALEAILDMNTAMGNGPEGLSTIAIQVGKALNDPAKGFTALRRAGVTFSEEQVKRIKALQKEGKLFEAQQIILHELAVEFGGSFKAQGQTAAGTIAGIGDAVEDLQTAIATALFPTVKRLLPQVQKFLTDPAFIAGVERLGSTIAGFFNDENVGTARTAIGSVVDILKTSAPLLEQVAGGMAGIVKGAVAAFQSLPPEIQKLAIAGFVVNKLTGGLVTNLAGGLISAVLKQLVSANVNIAATNVNVVGGGGLPNVLPAAGGAAAGAGGGLLAGAGALVIPVAIAAITVAAAGALANAIDPSALDPNRTPTTNRDPRRFNAQGQVIQNSIAKTTNAVNRGTGRIDHLMRQTRLLSPRLRAIESAEKGGLASVRRAVDRKDLAVNIHQEQTTNLVVNGRKLEASTQRYTSAFNPKGQVGI